LPDVLTFCLVQKTFQFLPYFDFSLNSFMLLWVPLCSFELQTLYKGKSAFKAEKVSVRVPATAKPGDVLEARTKSGEPVRVTVPANTKPGEVLVVKAPPTPGGKPAGTVTISGEELQACSEFLFLGLSGKHLANKDGFFSKSDPYYELHKAREDGSWIPVYRSVYLKNTLNPNWPVAKKISLQTLCNGDYDRPLRIEVNDMEAEAERTSPKWKSFVVIFELG